MCNKTGSNHGSDLGSDEAEGKARKGPQIHPTALVDPRAELAEGVVIGPFCQIGPHVVLERNVKLHSHVVIANRTRLGENCEVYPFAALGHPPQDLKFDGEESRLEIGPNTVIREHVTMHIGTRHGQLCTKVGAGGLFMVGAHVAHDCEVGDDVVFINNATLAGHCKIADRVILGGLCAVHQYVRIGEQAFVGGMAGVENDVIPYGMVIGNRAALAGLNLIGLKRRGLSREDIYILRRAYRMIFGQEGASQDRTLSERLALAEREFGSHEQVRQIIAFIKAPSRRSLCTPRRAK